MAGKCIAIVGYRLQATEFALRVRRADGCRRRPAQAALASTLWRVASVGDGWPSAAGSFAAGGGAFWSEGNIVSPNFDFNIGTSLFGDDVFDSPTLIANSIVDTGLDHNNNGQADIYKMSFDLGQEVSLSKDVTYYLSLTSIQDPGENPFVWQRR